MPKLMLLPLNKQIEHKYAEMRLGNGFGSLNSVEPVIQLTVSNWTANVESGSAQMLEERIGDQRADVRKISNRATQEEP